jgi:hypothetical protein
MARPMKRRRSVDPNQAWSAERLRLMLLAGALTAVLVMVGLGLFIVHAVQSATAPARGVAVGANRAGAATPANRRDELAAVPMASASPNTNPDAPASTVAPTIQIPKPAVPHGPAGVAAGFPQTPQGALGQLAAIDQLVITQMNLATAQAVYDAWAMPGGVGATGWVMTRNVNSFLTRMAQSDNPGTAIVTAAPTAGLVRATDGPDWVVACVQLDIHATIVQEAHIGYGHCERMAWTDGRWQIAPGAPPTQPGPLTPGSQGAADAGWRTWTT